MGLNKLLGRQITFNIIKNGLKHKRLSSALLFHGHSSCGKMTTALSLAKALNCSKDNNDFCDNCESCYKINSFSHPDITVVNTDDVLDKINLLYPYFVENPNTALLESLSHYINDLYYRYSSGFFVLKSSAKISKSLYSKTKDKIIENKLFLTNLKKELSWGIVGEESQKRLSEVIDFSKQLTESLTMDNIAIDTVRTILNKLYMTPVEGKHKVFIINGVDLMREETANTFLKGLEEPPPNNTIILITEKPDSILLTIKSRCFLIPFYTLSNNDNLNIIRDHFGIAMSDTQINDTLWAYLRKEEDNLKYKNLVNKFFHNIAENYLTSNDFIQFCDEVVSYKRLDDFFYNIVEYFREAKSIKYGVIKQSSIENKLYLLPDKTIDNLVNYGEELIEKIDTFHINPYLAITSYLMKLARHYKTLC
jgi:DNA polymerase III delta prime subunit